MGRTRRRLERMALVEESAGEGKTVEQKTFFSPNSTFGIHIRLTIAFQSVGEAKSSFAGPQDTGFCSLL
jgi:hypothetical protein